MISILAKLLCFLASFVQNALLIASFIGRLIVTSVTGFTNALVSGLESVLSFLQIVYEDNTRIFSEEIPTFFNSLVITSYNQLNTIIENLLQIFSDSINHLIATAEFFTTLSKAIGSTSKELLYITKEVAVFVGNTTWLILTFFPIQLPLMLQECFYYIKNIIVDVTVDAYMVLLKFTNFMTDVPLESFIGITSAILFVRLFVHFREWILIKTTELYWLLIRKVLYLYYTLINYVMDSEVRIITHMATGQDIETRENNLNVNVDDGTNSDTLCIICQERQKCVLTLPCRHVCLCAECCRRLYDYQRTCPICRTFIYHSVTVYL